MNPSEFKSNEYLISLFGCERFWNTVNNYLQLESHIRAKQITKTDFKKIIYLLFTGFNSDLGSIDDRLHNFKNTEKLVSGLDKIFSGEVAGERIVFDLASGSVYIYIKDKNGKLKVLDYHQPENQKLSDIEVTSFASKEFIQQAGRIYKYLKK